nr:hypothetical protein [uncultured bacterium]
MPRSPTSQDQRQVRATTTLAGGDLPRSGLVLRPKAAFSAPQADRHCGGACCPLLNP